MPESPSSTAVRIGLVAWAVQVLAIGVEIVVAAIVTVPYDLVRNTISELGAVTCAEYGVDGRRGLGGPGASRASPGWLSGCGGDHALTSANGPGTVD